MPIGGIAVTGAERTRNYRRRRRKHRRIFRIEADEFAIVDVLLELELIDAESSRNPALLEIAAGKFLERATEYFRVTRDARRSFSVLPRKSKRRNQQYEFDDQVETHAAAGAV